MAGRVRTRAYSGSNNGALAIEREVLRAFPEGFLERYELLWLRTFGSAVGGRSASGVVEPNVVATAQRVTRLSTNQTETRGGAHAGHKLPGVAERDVVVSAHALAFKRKVDAELRKVNRAMRVWLEAGGVGKSLGRRCSSCKRFGDEAWAWCPWCRGAMEEVDGHAQG